MEDRIKVFAQLGSFEEESCVFLDEDHKKEMILSFPDEKPNKTYLFEKLFMSEDGQDGVFESMKPAIHSLLNKSNSCVFSYGGGPETSILPMALKELFGLDKELNISVSMITLNGQEEIRLFEFRSVHLGNVEEALLLLPSKSATDDTVGFCVTLQTETTTSHLWLVELSHSCHNLSIASALSVHILQPLGIEYNLLVYVHISPKFSDHAKTLQALEFASIFKRIELGRGIGEGFIANLKFYTKARHQAFEIDYSFTPTTPKNPLGHAYDFLLTASSQRIFRSFEYVAYQSPFFRRLFVKSATIPQNLGARVASFLIKEPSVFSIPRTYSGTAGAYACARICVPALIAGVYKGVGTFLDFKSKAKDRKDLKLLIRKDINDSLQTYKENMNRGFATLQSRVDGMQATLQKLEATISSMKKSSS